jgi:hypothetical protein
MSGFFSYVRMCQANTSAATRKARESGLVAAAKKKQTADGHASMVTASDAASHTW